MFTTICNRIYAVKGDMQGQQRQPKPVAGRRREVCVPEGRTGSERHSEVQPCCPGPPELGARPPESSQAHAPCFKLAAVGPTPTCGPRIDSSWLSAHGLPVAARWISTVRFLCWAEEAGVPLETPRALLNPPLAGPLRGRQVRS